MEFIFETIYNQKAMTAMAKGVRKTARKKRTRRSHIFGWIVIALAVFLALADIKDGFEFTANRIITLLATLIILIVLLFEDRINGYVARKRMLPGTEKSRVIFNEEGFYSETEAGKSEWNYDRILMLAETKDYFIFIFSASHAQVYDKNNLSGGTVDEFRKFISERTGKTMVQLMKRKYSQTEVSKLMNGRIYINPDDLNIFVKRKGFCSWTMNLGNKWSWIIMGAEVLIVFAIIAIIKY